jgi:GT2 family glycosyltransferase
MKEHKFITPNCRVFHAIPWDSDKNIGQSYNSFMEMVDDDDWVCFLDGDAVHTSHFFGSRIEQIIDANPEYSLFTCYTNRVFCSWQIPPNVDKTTNDQKYHREFGDKLWDQNKTNVIDVTDKQLLSGVMILLSKDIWQRVGGFNSKGMLGVDNDIHKKVRNSGSKVGLMTGIYLQHWYRGGDYTNKKHLL